MARVYLGLGSNIDPARNLRLGLVELERRYGVLDRSAVYQSAADGFAGDDFWNMVVGLDTGCAPADIVREIDIIHDLAGRDRTASRFSSRPLDIDLLLYDDQVVEHPRFRLPRADVLNCSYVLRPLAELDPDRRHPQTGRTLGWHWRHFDPERHPLRRVEFDGQGQTGR